MQTQHNVVPRAVSYLSIMVEYSDGLFHLQILDAAEKYGNDIAMTDGQTGDNISYAKLRDDSYRFASALHSIGAKKGDIICVVLSNCSEYAITFLGAALQGCILSGVSPDSTQVEISNFLRITEAKFLVSSAEHYEVVKGFADQLILLIVDKESDQEGFHFGNLLRKSEVDYSISIREDISLDDTLMAPFSSGTSGTPKCVELSHRNYNASTAILKKALFDELSGGIRRVTTAVLPFFHSSGFWALCFCLLEGHRSITLGHFHPMMMLHCIAEYKIDTLNVVPAIIGYLCESDEQLSRWDISSVTTVLCGSAPLGKELSKRFLEKFPHVTNFVQGYGMTEVVVLSHITPLGTPVDDEKYLGSCGKLLPGFEAKLIDGNDGKEVKEARKCGELLVRSEAVMKGYLHNEAATKNVIDSDGWLHTGDVVYYDEEGFYFVVDRLKDLIKVNGLQVAPAELEDLLMTHPNIADAAVIGLADEHFGQVPMAFVVLKDSNGKDSLPEDIAEYMKNRVASHKQLKGGVRICESLPKTPSGKTIKKELIP